MTRIASPRCQSESSVERTQEHGLIRTTGEKTRGTYRDPPCACPFWTPLRISLRNNQLSTCTTTRSRSMGRQLQLLSSRRSGILHTCLRLTIPSRAGDGELRLSDPTSILMVSRLVGDMKSDHLTSSRLQYLRSSI